MAYCLHCEKEIPDGYSICESCNTIINANAQHPSQQVPPQQIQHRQVPDQQRRNNPHQQQQQSYQQEQQSYQQQQQLYQQQYGITDPADAPSAGFAFLGFLIPVLGFILWLVWKDKSPRKAKSCGKGALISLIIHVVFYIIVFIGVLFS